MGIFAKGHALRAVKRNALTEFADAGGGFKCFGRELLFYNGLLASGAEGFEEHVLDAGKMTGLDLLLDDGLLVRGYGFRWSSAAP
jgi:hypothetical protein